MAEAVQQRGDLEHDAFPAGFCRDRLWDANQTWNTDSPTLTACFQETVLIWIPSAFLFVCFPLLVLDHRNSRLRISRWTWLSLTKTIVCSFLFILSLLELSHLLNNWGNNHVSVSHAAMIGTSIKLLTTVCAVLSIFMDKYRGRTTSGVLFFYWFFLTVCEGLRFWSTVDDASRHGVEDDFLYVVHLAWLPLAFAQLILASIADIFREHLLRSQNPNPAEYASFPNRVVFWWFNHIGYLGWKRPLVQEDMYDTLPVNAVGVNYAKLQKNWDSEMKKMNKSRQDKAFRIYKPSIFNALVKAFWQPFLLTAIMRLGTDCALFVTPQLLSLLIEFVQNPAIQSWKGYLYVAALVCSTFSQAIFNNTYMHIAFRTGMRLEASIIASVYRKALTITNGVKQSNSVGEIVNLMAVDAFRFFEFMSFVHNLWSGPMQICLAVYFLYNLFGLAALAGLIAIILTLPINAFALSRMRLIQNMQMKQKDNRIKLMNEILNGIKVLKLYAWEEPMEKQILATRDKELKLLKRAALWGALSYVVFVLTPFVVAVSTFSAYLLVNKVTVLGPSEIFVSISLMNILRQPLAILSPSVTAAVQVRIAANRLSKFLRSDELDLTAVEQLPSTDPNVVVVNKGTFTWTKGEPACLHKIDLTIPAGQLIAVVGQVGTGKSSLCAAIIGLMEKVSGNIACKGRIAYVPQQAWIQNLTVKENILFGKEMNESKYQQVIKACALLPDLESFSAGDETEIGERGANLSGGQRQRISLARAVYSDADVYILDDPLSAVDAHVVLDDIKVSLMSSSNVPPKRRGVNVIPSGKALTYHISCWCERGEHIFLHVIGPKGLLQSKARLLVTHGIGFLPQMDKIFVLANQTVSESGSYRQLLSNNGDFAEFLRTYLREETEETNDTEYDTKALKEKILEELSEAPSELPNGSVRKSSHSSLKRVRSVLREASRLSTSKSDLKEKAVVPTGAAGKLVEMEKSAVGTVKWSIYIMYMKALSLRASFMILFFFGSYSALGAGSSFWLSQWARDEQFPERTNSTDWTNYRLGVFGAFGSVQAIMITCHTLTMAYARVRAGGRLHENLLKRIMRAPMSFFDTTPLGRLVVRFSKDVDTVDVVVPSNTDLWLYFAFGVLATMTVISVSTPPLIGLMVPLVVFYFFIQRFYIVTSTQLKRLQSVSKAPIFSHFQESITGSGVIVATKQGERFLAENQRLINNNNKCFYLSMVSQRWIGVRLEILGVFVTVTAALIAVTGRGQDWGLRPDQAGLSIGYSLSVNGLLNGLLWITSELESNIVAVERIKEYAEAPQEAAWVVPAFRPPKEWPPEGRVDFSNYQTRYRPGLDLVLKGVTAQIKSGEKIGIVGRTGAGKSSMTLALFRIIEAQGGSIEIDDLNIQSMGLHDVRSRITILPQEPVLFSGSLRMNLDPFDTYKDEEVWDALEHSHLKRFVSTLPEGLNHQVVDGGENYSVGQRQLICLARALLRKTKILVLDEATAAIDLHTDDLIQQTIRDKFADCTILTIAHRINTIMDSTRIMVLDGGRISEFAPPADLLSNRNGVFYGLAKAANLVS